MRDDRKQMKAAMVAFLIGGAGSLHAAASGPQGAALAELAASALALESWATQSGGAMAEANTFSIYLNTPANDLRLHSIRTQWGDAPPRQVDLNHQTAEALRVGGVYRLAVPLDAAGPQRLRVDLIASRMTSSARIARLRLQFSEVIDPTGFMELVLQQKGLRNQYSLALAETPSSERALRAGAAELLLNTGHPYRAAAELAAWPSSGGADRVDAVASRARQALGIAPASSGVGGATASPYNEVSRMLADGRGDQGWAALKAVAAQTDNTPAARVLRDRANLALAQQALYEGQGQQAAAYFGQVHSPGPYASRALLGLGWSYLLSNSAAQGAAVEGEATGLAVHTRLPSASTLRPGSADDTAALRRQSPFRYAQAVVTGARRENLERALNAWQELIGRDPSDPVVQEGMLATAYAFDHLGAHQQALQRYQRALDQMLVAHAHLGQAVDHVEQGQMFAAMEASEAAAASDWSWWLLERRDARWWMDERSEASPLFYMERLLENDTFRAHMSDYQTLRAIAARLDELGRLPGLGQDARVTTLRQRVADAMSARRQQIESLAVSELRQWRTHTEAYVAEAHLAMARIYDKPDAAPSPYLLGGAP